MSPRVAAIVLNWNQSRMTLDCVAALRKSERLCDRIILVDNGSRPEQRAILTDVRTASDVTFLPLTANRGFAGGMNAGIREAVRIGADYVWLVNNDAFPEPNCLSQLIYAFEANPTLAAVGPRLVGVDGVEQHAGGQFDHATGQSTCFFSEEFPVLPKENSFWLIGTAPLFRLAPLEAAKGFDDRFFAYMEEIDLCLRIGREGGRFQVVPDAKVIHIGHASSGGGFPPIALYFHTRNQLLLCQKHVQGGSSLSFTIRYLRTCLDHAGCFVANEQPERGQAIVDAIFALITRESGSPKWYARNPWVSKFLARHPWQLIRALDLLLRFIGPKTAKGVSA